MAKLFLLNSSIIPVAVCSSVTMDQELHQSYISKTCFSLIYLDICMYVGTNIYVYIGIYPYMYVCMDGWICVNILFDVTCRIMSSAGEECSNTPMERS